MLFCHTTYTGYLADSEARDLCSKSPFMIYERVNDRCLNDLLPMQPILYKPKIRNTNSTSTIQNTCTTGKQTLRKSTSSICRTNLNLNPGVSWSGWLHTNCMFRWQPVAATRLGLRQRSDWRSCLARSERQIWNVEMMKGSVTTWLRLFVKATPTYTT